MAVGVGKSWARAYIGAPFGPGIRRPDHGFFAGLRLSTFSRYLHEGMMLLPAWCHRDNRSAWRPSLLASPLSCGSSSSRLSSNSKGPLKATYSMLAPLSHETSPDSGIPVRQHLQQNPRICQPDRCTYAQPSASAAESYGDSGVACPPDSPVSILLACSP
ncbi:hypothetical protein BC834DRAFT_902068, partial [Gloeopeniophorella convolvens]